jgi:hypothetical protein
LARCERANFYEIVCGAAARSVVDQPERQPTSAALS